MSGFATFAGLVLPAISQHIVAIRAAAAQGAESEGLLGPEAMATFLVDAILVIINLAVMYIILKQFVYKPILKAMDKRRDKIREELESAAKREEEARRKNEEAQENLEASVSEAVRIVGEAKSRARLEADNIVKDAKLEAAAFAERGRQENRRLRRSMINEVREEIADLSVSIATQVVGEVMSRDQQKQVVDRILDERLEEMERQENLGMPDDSISAVPPAAKDSGAGKDGGDSTGHSNEAK